MSKFRVGDLVHMNELLSMDYRRNKIFIVDRVDAGNGAYWLYEFDNGSILFESGQWFVLEKHLKLVKPQLQFDKNVFLKMLGVE